MAFCKDTNDSRIFKTGSHTYEIGSSRRGMFPIFYRSSKKKAAEFLGSLAFRGGRYFFHAAWIDGQGTTKGISPTVMEELADIMSGLTLRNDD